MTHIQVPLNALPQTLRRFLTCSCFRRLDSQKCSTLKLAFVSRNELQIRCVFQRFLSTFTDSDCTSLCCFSTTDQMAVSGFCRFRGRVGKMQSFFFNCKYSLGRRLPRSAQGFDKVGVEKSPVERFVPMLHQCQNLICHKATIVSEKSVTATRVAAKQKRNIQVSLPHSLPLSSVTLSGRPASSRPPGHLRRVRRHSLEALGQRYRGAAGRDPVLLQPPPR